MYLKKLNIIQFKNFEEADMSFSPHINLFTGKNGEGKTNLTDAVYALCLTKSFLQATEPQMIRKGFDFFSLLGVFEKGNKFTQVQFDYSNQNKKNFRADKSNYEKLSEHIGRFPVVLITPFDQDLIRDGSEERRKFFDSIIAQFDPDYLDALIRYNQLLKNRNSHLKALSEKKSSDLSLLETYDEMMLPLMKKIYERRKKLVEEFHPYFIHHYNTLSSEKESPSLVYDSALSDQRFEEYFFKNRSKDILLERTGMGIHKDDYKFLMNDFSVKNIASQGQQKTYVIALKLAQFDVLKMQKGYKPILILDDIFDKLDDFRIKQLIGLISGEKFGQLFITDARPERSSGLLKDIKAEKFLFKIAEGRIERQ